MYNKEENTSRQPWWETGIIYQIYPRSFQDTNQDGVGDLNGVIQRLDYLKWMQVDCIWLSPVFPSPMADFGYDISDYTGIDPLFGSIDDFDRLISEVHRRDMKLILDLVPNHTSDQHPWFRESRKDLRNRKRNWYIWHEGGPDHTPPNNWKSVFGGPAWEYDSATGQFYYHAFLKEQPDLNWRNPEVWQAILDVMRFWLEKQVDGFRVDVMWHMVKDELLRNNPSQPGTDPASDFYDDYLPVYSTDQPEVHEIVRAMRELLDSYGQKVLIGEIYLPVSKLIHYYGKDNKGAHLPFNFQLLTAEWKAEQISAIINEYEGALPEGGWPNWVLGNHDQRRIATRIGLPQARVAAMLLLTLRGTPTLYYGEEIGMTDVAIPQSEIVDPQGLGFPDLYASRDPGRTPMQWDSSPYAGFSQTKAWLRLAHNYSEVNVANQQHAPGSMLNLYRKLIDLRKKEPAFTRGAYTPLYTDQQVLAYVRAAPEGDKFLVVLNLTAGPARFDPPHQQWHGEVVINTLPGREGLPTSGPILLNGDEGLIIRLEPGAGNPEDSASTEGLPTTGSTPPRIR